MDTFKLTSWNVEHADKLIDRLADADPGRKRKAERRFEAIRDEIAALDADILFVGEGPNGEVRARAFFEQAAPGYDLVVRGTDDRRAYGMSGTDQTTGRQWLWFLVKRDRGINASLLHLDIWQHHTEQNSNGAHKNGRWDVSFPKLAGDHLEFEIDRNHRHWRHPQVLQVEIGGASMEIVGCHLKSKYTRVRPQGDASDPLFFENNQGLVADVIKARVKISTECADVRHYIDQRFEEDANAAIIVAGDLNDGPGKEVIERRFLYHDLISTLQGEVFFARRFLNHALFDLEESERWTVFFKDRIDPGRNPRILLDHILFSQSLTGRDGDTKAAYRARPGGGYVEHDVHHAITGPRPRYAMTSDHKPVSMFFDRRQPGG
ncbi:MAG: endonuclease/exonuclease/phosphatase [Pseudomonadota bacterium]